MKLEPKKPPASKWTKWNIGLALFMTATTVSVLLFRNRDTNRYRKESEHQSKETLQQGEINKSVLELKTELHQISLSLQDTAKVKVKIEK